MRSGEDSRGNIRVWKRKKDKDYCIFNEGIRILKWNLKLIFYKG